MSTKFNLFQTIDVTGTNFSTLESIGFNFIPKGLSLINRGFRIIEYSFDGTNVHGDLNPADSSFSITFKNRSESRIWFRVPTGIATSVRVEVWE